MKAVLVVDMPTSCEDCHLRLALDRYRCINTKENRLRWCGDEDGFYTSDTKPSWCPLRPLPQKADKGMEVDISGGDDYESGYIHGWHRGVDKGWNDCLEEITGETE